MEEFITWEMLASFSTVVSIVYIVTQFTKDILILKRIHTKYYSAFIAFLLIFITNIQVRSFQVMDIILYALSAIIVSMAANGIHDFDHKRKHDINP